MWRHSKSFVWDRFTAYILHRTIYHYWSPLKGKLNDWIRILLCGNIEATHLCTLESPSGQILTFWKICSCGITHFYLSLPRWTFTRSHTLPEDSGKLWSRCDKYWHTVKLLFSNCHSHLSKQGIYREGCPNWLNLQKL